MSERRKKRVHDEIVLVIIVMSSILMLKELGLKSCSCGNSFELLHLVKREGRRERERMREKM